MNPAFSLIGDLFHQLSFRREPLCQQNPTLAQKAREHAGRIGSQLRSCAGQAGPALSECLADLKNYLHGRTLFEEVDRSESPLALKAVRMFGDIKDSLMRAIRSNTLSPDNAKVLTDILEIKKGYLLTPRTAPIILAACLKSPERNQPEIVALAEFVEDFLSHHYSDDKRAWPKRDQRRDDALAKLLQPSAADLDCSAAPCPSLRLALLGVASVAAPHLFGRDSKVSREIKATKLGGNFLYSLAQVLGSMTDAQLQSLEDDRLPRILEGFINAYGAEQVGCYLGQFISGNNSPKVCKGVDHLVRSVICQRNHAAWEDEFFLVGLALFEQYSGPAPRQMRLPELYEYLQGRIEHSTQILRADDVELDLRGKGNCQVLNERERAVLTQYSGRLAKVLVAR